MSLSSFSSIENPNWNPNKSVGIIIRIWTQNPNQIPDNKCLARSQHDLYTEWTNTKLVILFRSIILTVAIHEYYTSKHKFNIYSYILPTSSNNHLSKRTCSPLVRSFHRLGYRQHPTCDGPNLSRNPPTNASPIPPQINASDWIQSTPTKLSAAPTCGRNELVA